MFATCHHPWIGGMIFRHTSSSIFQNELTFCALEYIYIGLYIAILVQPRRVIHKHHILKHCPRLLRSAPPTSRNAQLQGFRQPSRWLWMMQFVSRKLCWTVCSLINAIGIHGVSMSISVFYLLTRWLVPSGNILCQVSQSLSFPFPDCADCRPREFLHHGHWGTRERRSPLSMFSMLSTLLQICHTLTIPNRNLQYEQSWTIQILAHPVPMCNSKANR